MSRHRTIVNVVHRAVIGLVLPAALLAASGCGKSLNMDGAKKAISDGLTAQLGLEMASVTCPTDSRPLKSGDTFECTGTPKGGGSLTVKVTQKDDQGNINWELTKIAGLLDMKKIEAAVQAGLKEKTEADDTVSCGSARLRPSKAGDTFECTAKDQEGQATTVVITVKDGEGNVGWAVKE